MAPKFRGSSDDWLDDQSARARGRAGMKSKKGAPESKATDLDWELANAVVCEVFPKQCRVRMLAASEEGGVSTQVGEELLCSYRRVNVFRQGEDLLRERTPVAVGDRVVAKKISTGAGVVEGLCARRNFLSRMAPGEEKGRLQHVIAANVDWLVIVASVREPEFTPGLIDRYLVAALSGGIPALICMTKLDLLGADERHPVLNYRELGFEVAEVCSRSGSGVEELKQRLLGKEVVFCGKSGVGKTSLLRALIGSDVGRVGEVSGATGKGRHTTTGAVLLNGPSGSQWIDTPGVREFGLVGVDEHTLGGFFPELQRLDCSKSGCLHAGEPECQAAGLWRHESYLRILESLRSGEY